MEHSTTDKNKTSYSTTTSPWSHKIDSLDQSVTLPPHHPLLVFFSPAFSRLLVHPCLSPVPWLHLYRKWHCSCSPHSPPSSSPVAPSAPRRVYWRPYNERARRRQRQPQASPGGPCLTAHNLSSSRISTVCCLVHTDQAVSFSRIHLLSWLPVLIPPPRLPHASPSGISIKGWLALYLNVQ